MHLVPCRRRGLSLPRSAHALLLAALFSVALAGTPAFGQLPLTDDTYDTPPANNNASAGNTNYGGSQYVLVQAPGVSSYLLFDTTKLPAGVTAGNIQKAYLRLYIDAITQSGSLDVHLVSKSWSESALTYNTAPAWGNMVASGVVLKPKKQFVDIDVTPAVAAWLNGTPNYGLVLSPSSGSTISASFDSKENTNTSHNAELELILVNVGPQGPAGSAATVSVGSTSTLAAGSAASVTNTGTSSVAVLNFSIPQGASGAMGLTGPPGPAGMNNRGAWNSATAYNPSDSVYDAGSYWLALSANTGSEPTPVNTNWQVPTAGINNRGAWGSATNYNVNDAVMDGGSSWLALKANNGSEPAGGNTNWQLLAAQGAPGIQGMQGISGISGVNGMSATVAVGTVTTLAPGSPATVSNSGNANAAVLDFGIPQGAAGSGSGGGNGMAFSAFLPGKPTANTIAGDIQPNQGITVTRVTIRDQAVPQPCSGIPATIRITDGSTGQDLPVSLSTMLTDSGPFALKFAANADVQIQLQPDVITDSFPCSSTPTDTNVVVQYKVTDSSDVETCAQGGQACNGICELTVTDNNNCGACGKVCNDGTFANASATPCANSTCSMGACNQGYADCNHNTADGCEVNLNNDANNCGACGNVCMTQGANTSGTPSCQSSICVNSCALHYGDCDGNPANGCETNLSSDANNCGGCGNVCPETGDICNHSICKNSLASGDSCVYNTECASAVCGPVQSTDQFGFPITIYECN